ncbi:MAG: MBL fold metallo-hydrolase [Promethearchaeota archaeon]|nr:MAG: MBL fold metallo-hydrolase [Candidatus Lokiarchaeota archaeon]
MAFTKLFNNIYRFQDYVNVYAIKSGTKAILIDFGSGEVLDHLSEIGIEEVEYILHTHYHRDQCFGDKRALEKSIKIGVPDKEKKLFLEAEKFWKMKSYYDIYFFKPTFFVSTYNIPVELTFKDGEEFEWENYKLKILETSGHTTGSVSYLLEVDGKKVAFTGDLIHSGGKVITYYDLQYIYNDSGENGIVRSFESFKKLLEYQPDVLLPSHGDIIEDPRSEIKALVARFERARNIFSSRNASIEHMFTEQQEQQGIPMVNLEEFFPSIIHKGFSPPYIVKGSHENCILIDFAGCSFFGYTEDQLDKMLEENNIKTIDFVIPTHYHDDHTAGFSLLQKRGIKIYALENIAKILENPTHFRIGCLAETPIKVDRVLKDGEILKWDDTQFQVFHFPGQTEYHMGMFGKVDGKSIFWTGDSISAQLWDNRSNSMNCINHCQFGENVGHMKCAEILLKCNPEYLAISHYGIIKVYREHLEEYKKYVSEYEPIVAEIVAQEDANMGYDPNWIGFKPIRVITSPGSQFKTNLVVRNYLNKTSSIEVELNLPENWEAEKAKFPYEIAPKKFEEIPITIKIPKNEDPNGRTIITANIIWNGVNLGPFPDLMVDHGYNPSKPWSGWTPDEKSNLVMWIFKHIRRDNKFFS